MERYYLAIFMVVCVITSLSTLLLALNKSRSELGTWGRISVIFIIAWFIGWPIAYLLGYVSSHP